MKKIFALVISWVMVIAMIVPASAHWVDDWVPLQVQQQLISYSGISSDVDQPIARRPFAKVLAKDFEMTTGAPMGPGGLYVEAFVDCSDQDVYNLATQGIISGMGAGMFNPDGLLTRRQCAVMVAKAVAPTKATSSNRSNFPDVQNDWGENEIAFLAEHGVIHGFPDGLFHPDEYLTAAQAMKILHTAQQKFGWVGVEQFSGATTGTGNSYGAFSPTPQQGQGYTNPDGTWNSGYNNGYYNDNYYQGSNGGVFSDPNGGYTGGSNSTGGAFSDPNGGYSGSSNSPLYGAGFGV